MAIVVAKRRYLPGVGIRRRLRTALASHGPVRPQIEALIRQASADFDWSSPPTSPASSLAVSQYEAGSEGGHAKHWATATLGSAEHATLQRLAEHQRASMSSVLEGLVVVYLQQQGHQRAALMPSVAPRTFTGFRSTLIDPALAQRLAARGKIRPQINALIGRAYRGYDFSAPAATSKSRRRPPGASRSVAVGEAEYAMLGKLAQHQGRSRPEVLEQLVVDELDYCRSKDELLGYGADTGP